MPNETGCAGRRRIHSFKTEWSKHERWCINNTSTSEHLDNKPYMEITKIFYRKNLWAKSPPYLGFLQAIFIVRQKVLLLPSKTGWSKPEIMRSTAKEWKWLTDAENVIKWARQQHVIVGCSSLSESTYFRRHNQLAKIIHQQTAKSYKLLQRNTPPHCRYKPEPVLQSANMILYWERSIITDEKVNFNRPDKVFIDRGGKNSTCNRYSSSLDP